MMTRIRLGPFALTGFVLGEECAAAALAGPQPGSQSPLAAPSALLGCVPAAQSSILITCSGHDVKAKGNLEI